MRHWRSYAQEGETLAAFILSSLAQDDWMGSELIQRGCQMAKAQVDHVYCIYPT